MGGPGEPAGESEWKAGCGTTGREGVGWQMMGDFARRDQSRAIRNETFADEGQ